MIPRMVSLLAHMITTVGRKKQMRDMALHRGQHLTWTRGLLRSCRILTNYSRVTKGRRVAWQWRKLSVTTETKWLDANGTHHVNRLRSPQLWHIRGPKPQKWPPQSNQKEAAANPIWGTVIRTVNLHPLKWSLS